MNKKGALGALAILGIIAGALILINIIGFGIFINNLGKNPILIVVLLIGIIILLRQLNK